MAEKQEQLEYKIKVYPDWDNFFRSECQRMPNRRMEGSSFYSPCLSEDNYIHLRGGEALFLPAPLPKQGEHEAGIADFSSVRNNGNLYYVLVRIYSSIDKKP
jgi:hypothetical protein